MNKLPFLLLSLLAFSCQPSSQTQETTTKEIKRAKDPNKVYNLKGEELPQKELDDQTLEKYRKNLVSAFFDFQANQDSLELIIWYGRRLAYLGKFEEAILVYTDGLVPYPNSYRLRRHRGHRYISTRQIERAIIDLAEAASLSEKAENRLEPDGIPNELNRPLSNDKFNIWYHLGLAYYLNGQFDEALSSYIECTKYCDNNDLKIASSYWQYLTHQKLGNTKQAEELLSELDTRLALIENDDYLALLKLYKGELSPEDLLKEAEDAEGSLDPTLAYGIGSYYQHNGDAEQANELFLQVSKSPNWDAFGYIAAEVELMTIAPLDL